MAPVRKMFIGGVALATLQGCGGPEKDTNQVDIIAPVKLRDDMHVADMHVADMNVAEVQSNVAQIVDEVENIGAFDANVSGQGVESDGNMAGGNVEDLPKKTQQIWNAVMSKKGGAIAAAVALTGTLAATAIGYKVKQHRAQAGRTCTAVGEGVSDKFVGVSYYDGQKVNFECATGYTLTTDGEVTVECDANGEARITACSKNSLTILGSLLRKFVIPGVALGVVGYAALLIFRFTKTDDKKPVQADMTAINILKSNFVNQCYNGDDRSSTQAGFAKLISFVVVPTEEAEKEQFSKKLTEHLNMLLTDDKKHAQADETAISKDSAKDHTAPADKNATGKDSAKDHTAPADKNAMLLKKQESYKKLYDEVQNYKGEDAKSSELNKMILEILKEEINDQSVNEKSKEIVAIQASENGQQLKGGEPEAAKEGPAVAIQASENGEGGEPEAAKEGPAVAIQTSENGEQLKDGQPEAAKEEHEDVNQ